MSSRLTRLAALTAVALSISGVASSPAFAIDPTSKAAINTDPEGLAMQGYDPVAYFTDGAPQKGDARFKVAREGATYYFASAANMERFKANPAAYLPQFGGFCAMGTAMGKKFEGDPKVWKIVDNKLFLNFNPDVGRRWGEDIPTNITRANDNWPTIMTKTPEELENQ